MAQQHCAVNVEPPGLTTRSRVRRPSEVRQTSATFASAVVLRGTKRAGAGLFSCSGSEAAIRSRQCLIRKRPPHLSAPGLAHADETVPWDIFKMSASKSRASSIKRHTASMAHVLTWLRNTSFPATGAPGFGSIALSPVRSSAAARKRIQGARIAAFRTAIR